MILFDRIKQGLARTREAFVGSVRKLLGQTLDQDTLDRLEESLILADIGVEASGKIITDLRQAFLTGALQKGDDVLARLQADLTDSLKQDPVHLNFNPDGLTVIMVAGVNGTGKTTSIAKLAKFLKDQNKSVLLAAGDTFRAAAGSQLQLWAERIGVPIVRHQHGSDPAAVAFDAADAALARHIDVLIVDTAGRLHTEKNLMLELNKIQRVLAKKVPGAPHEILLVLDATTGQNAVSQARLFREHVPLTGIFLAKLDGTAKGGIVVAIRSNLQIPVKFIGVGESADDIEVFDAERFVNALFS